MIIIYSPEGAEPENLDAGRMRASEIQLIERTADSRWDAIQEAMSEGDVNALRTVGWAVKRRTHAALRYADFDPFEDELKVRLDAREVRAYVQRILAKYGSEPDDLASAFDELRDSAFDRADADTAIADATAPKDPEPETELSPASPTES
ncbi:hypothetical protein OG985_21750 [Streptomyces sp. NBC_00289]|uniref:hypothetical protein n=1 Tax=Streptomyces sp. NBC_00289 TaxID=2975703 RepID=UPI00324D51B5